MAHSDLICFTCGLPAPSQESIVSSASARAEPMRLNRTQDGEVCDACAQRLLEAMPSLVSNVRADQIAAGKRSSERESRGSGSPAPSDDGAGPLAG